jgi:signal transduction histidine kinase
MPGLAATLRVLRISGLFAWLLVAAPALVQGAGNPRAFVFWLGSLLAFGLLFAWSTGTTSRPGPALSATLAAESACVIVMVAIQCRGLEGTLLVLVALQLALVAERRAGLAVIALQSAALAAAIAHHWTPRQAFLLTPPYFGFQLLAFLLMERVVLESRGRLQLERLNAELASTHELLAESARLGERLRIARELHDAMGHHLVALSLNLEALDPTAARAPLETARGLTRRLLDDVERVAHTLDRERGVDLSAALRALAADIPSPRVHVDARELRSDPERAHTLLRCCQEIVTNSVKHAHAANLWITIQSGPEGVLLEARDDGAGTDRLVLGHGLSGMRRRVEELGGALDLETRSGAGFRLRALFPVAAGA